MKFLNIIMILSILLFNSCSLEEDEKDAKIKVFVDNQEINNGGNIYLPDQLINVTHNYTIKIQNSGDKSLAITSIIKRNTIGDSFLLFNEYDISITGGNENLTNAALYTTITSFFECEITITSNASNAPIFEFSIQATTSNP